MNRRIHLERRSDWFFLFSIILIFVAFVMGAGLIVSLADDPALGMAIYVLCWAGSGALIVAIIGAVHREEENLRRRRF